METNAFGYKKLRIWQDARSLVNDIHRMTIEDQLAKSIHQFTRGVETHHNESLP
jgi:hypothetical protein